MTLPCFALPPFGDRGPVSLSMGGVLGVSSACAASSCCIYTIPQLRYRVKGTRTENCGRGYFFLMIESSYIRDGLPQRRYSVTTRTATHQALLAARLEAVMRRQGFSVRQLALRAGLPLSVVQKLIAGEGRQTSIWTLVQLADTLAVSLDYLVGRATSDADTKPPQRETQAQGQDTTAPQPTAKRPRTRKTTPVAERR